MNFDINRLYLTTDGRIGRQDFWIGIIGLIIVSIVINLIVGGIFGWISTAALVMQLIVQIVLAYPGYALLAKRFQDRDKAGTLAAIGIGLSILVSLLNLTGITGGPLQQNWLGMILSLALAVVGIWYLIELGFLRGTQGSNQYGPDPLGG